MIWGGRRSFVRRMGLGLCEVEESIVDGESRWGGCGYLKVWGKWRTLSRWSERLGRGVQRTAIPGRRNRRTIKKEYGWDRQAEETVTARRREGLGGVGKGKEKGKRKGEEKRGKGGGSFVHHHMSLENINHGKALLTWPDQN